jgi:REP element-mobilizing transposase RayT
MRKGPGRPRRLPAKDYEGEKTVSFDACTWDRIKLFRTPEVVLPQVEFLRLAAAEFQCIVPIYCFMPDHMHAMLMGESKHSNALKAMAKFKSLSG